MEQTQRVRAETGRRAGTVMGPTAKPIYGQAKKSLSQHGLLDEEKGVYQCGGELSGFVYWRQRVVSLSMVVWEQLVNLDLTLEFIDHDKNECWRVTSDIAKKYGKGYEAGLGPRFGIPMTCFDVVQADGTVRTAAAFK